MIVKKHIAEGRRLILAVCDEDLLGKKFEEKGKQLDIARAYYEGEKLSEEEVIKLIPKAYIINATGKKAVACCVKAQICTEEEINMIKGIPYYQAVLF